MRVNFLEKKRSLLKHRADLLFGVFLLIAVGSFHMALLNDTGSQISVLKERIAFLNKEVQSNKQVKMKLKELKRTENEITQKSALLRMLKERKNVPPLAVYFAQNGTPKGVWLTELKIGSDGTEINGGALDINGLIKLIGNLREYGSFSLNQISQDTVEFKNIGKKVQYYKYSLTR